MLIFLFGVVCAGPLSAEAATQPGGKVRIIEVDGVIDPATADYLRSALAGAESDGVVAAVIELDTPGGLSVSMRSIISEMLNLNVPTVVWVAPRGARAASAGTFITYAANLAYMASSTEIGAASPVDISGGDIGKTLRAKIVNDSVAYIREIARERNRNVRWAERAVREAASLGATRAAAINVVDGIASSQRDLLQAMDGRRVTGDDGNNVTLRTWQDSRNRPTVFVERQSMNAVQSLLHAVTDPNIAYLLLLLGGILGIAVEVLVPGFGLPGILGAVALVLGAYGLSALPTNWAGVALIALAVIFFLADLHAAGLGIWTLGGALALLGGGSLLFSGASPAWRVGLPVLVTTVALFVAFFGFALGAVVRMRRRPSIMGEESLVGAEGETTTVLDPEGTVRARGTLWRARAQKGAIEEGEPVRVVSSEGLVLVVEPVHMTAERNV
jgi:membrane-bound serine protease (ClpP class)